MMKRRDAKGDFSLRNLEHFSDRFTMICNDLNKLSIRLDLISDSLITKKPFLLKAWNLFAMHRTSRMQIWLDFFEANTKNRKWSILSILNLCWFRRADECAQKQKCTNLQELFRCALRAHFWIAAPVTHTPLLFEFQTGETAIGSLL